MPLSYPRASVLSVGLSLEVLQRSADITRNSSQPYLFFSILWDKNVLDPVGHDCYRALCIIYVRFDLNFVSWVASQKKVLAQNKNNQYRSHCAPPCRGQCDTVCIRADLRISKVGLLLRHCLFSTVFLKQPLSLTKQLKSSITGNLTWLEQIILFLDAN